MKVLLEMRPALDGHAGIPQETRLLFRGLQRLPGIEVEGLLQSSNRLLARGLPEGVREGDAGWPADRCVHRQSRVLVSLQPPEHRSPWAKAMDHARLALATAGQIGGTALGLKQSLSRLESRHFEDWVWRGLFARTLPPEDREAVLQARWRVARMPWVAQHHAALATRRLGLCLYPQLDTRGTDVMVAETPYPGRVSAGTRLVVRYHDAIPLLMPHTISNKSFHQASHFHALQRNVRDGAWFACVSEATRRDLLSVFPQAADRAVTLPNMVSHHYHEDANEAGAALGVGRIADILRIRQNLALAGGGGAGRLASAAPLAPLEPPAPRSAAPAGGGAPAYLLMVSTIEPRKNHLSLLAAWEQLRASGHPDLQLVLVGHLGWDHKSIVAKLRPWLQRGGLHVLEDVPADELRLLYRHAQATVCPSFGEGFDFSGVEAMRCGGVVAASDIAVHRDVYDTAFEPFDPYAVPQLVAALQVLLDPEATDRREALRADGRRVARRYLPETLLPQWQAFLRQLPPAVGPGPAR